MSNVIAIDSPVYGPASVLIELAASKHLLHESMRADRTLNVNEFAYRHREGTYRVTTETFSTWVVNGAIALDERKRAKVVTVQVPVEASEPTCYCERTREHGSNWRKGLKLAY